MWSAPNIVYLRASFLSAELQHRAYHRYGPPVSKAICVGSTKGGVNVPAGRSGGPTKQCQSSSRWVMSSATDVTTTAASSMAGMLSAKQKRTGCSRCALTSCQVCCSDRLALWKPSIRLACPQPVIHDHAVYLTKPEEKEGVPKVFLRGFPKVYSCVSFLAAVSQGHDLFLKQCHKAITVSFLCCLGCIHITVCRWAAPALLPRSCRSSGQALPEYLRSPGEHCAPHPYPHPKHHCHNRIQWRSIRGYCPTLLAEVTLAGMDFQLGCMLDSLADQILQNSQ